MLKQLYHAMSSVVGEKYKQVGEDRAGNTYWKSERNHREVQYVEKENLNTIPIPWWNWIHRYSPAPPTQTEIDQWYHEQDELKQRIKSVRIKDDKLMYEYHAGREGSEFGSFQERIEKRD